MVDKKTVKKLEVFFKAISHPARIAILEELRKGEHCVCHLEAMLDYRQSYVSQHLAVLREAGLITDRRDGWNVYYRVTNDQVFELLDKAYTITGTKMEQRSSIKGCPCKNCNHELEVDENGEYQGSGIRVC